jgi:hypothetical protein
VTTDIEPRLRALLHSTGDTIHPPVDLVERGLERGQRVRRWRRMGRVTAAAVAVVVVVTGSAVVVRGSDTDSAFGGWTVSGVSTPLHLPPPAGNTTEPIAARSAAVILLSLLPAGTAWNHGGQDDPGILHDPGAPAVYAYTTYDDGDGPVQVGVNHDHGWCLTWSCAEQFEAEHGKPTESESARRQATAGHIFGCATRGEQCEQRDLKDGSRLLIFAPRADHRGLTQTVQLVRKDGTRIAILQETAIPDYESGNGKTFPAARDDLPLSVDQLVAIVTSPLWQDRVSDSVSAAGETLESFHHLDNTIAGSSAR